MKSTIQTLVLLLTGIAFAPWLSAQEAHDHGAHGAASAPAGSGSQGTGMDHSGMDHSDHSMDPSNTDHSDHSGMDHSMQEGSSGGGETHHQGHGMEHGDHAASPKASGDWSYLKRDNPQPYPAKDRWEMVPVPGYGHLYLSAEGVSRDLRCAALRENPRVMVDRATRRACGMPQMPTVRESSAGRAAAPGKLHSVEDEAGSAAHAH